MKIIGITIGLSFLMAGNINEGDTFKRFKSVDILEQRKHSTMIFADPSLQDYYIRSQAILAAAEIHLKIRAFDVSPKILEEYHGKVIQTAKRFEKYINTGE